MTPGDQTIFKTEIEGVFLIDKVTSEDERGFFKEVFRKNELEEKLGYSFDPIQFNHSRSKKGILRGIHVAPWAKLFYVPYGVVQQVVVDFRQNSPTFGQHLSMTLGEDNKQAVFVPAFCGNAFLVLSEEADCTYLTSDYWQLGKELGALWNDPKLKIIWQIKEPVLSNKDKENLTFTEVVNKLR